MADSWFSKVSVAPPIEVFALSNEFKEDPFPEKVNLTVGAYRTNDSEPWVLPVVRAVESQMSSDGTLNHEYLPVAGSVDYRRAAARLLLGSDSRAIAENRVEGIQAVGGTGALRIAMDFLKNTINCDTIYVSNPTWGNHKGIAKSLGFSAIKEYRYWNQKTFSIDMEGFISDLNAAPPRSVVILHMCAHNPTGVDPTEAQWQDLASVIKEKNIFPLFDCAYQGFASGDLGKDAGPVRLFDKLGFELIAAQSFSKNFGLYNERVGCLQILCNSQQHVSAVKTQLETKVRQTWSNSPNHGSRIVGTVLNNAALTEEWKESVKTMANRIQDMRSLLYEKLRSLGTPGTWSHITEQCGMFSYTGLSLSQSEQMIKKHHVYMLKSGRINMCAITTKNAGYVAAAIHDVITSSDCAKL